MSGKTRRVRLLESIVDGLSSAEFFCCDSFGRDSGQFDKHAVVAELPDENNPPVDLVKD
jgi:hypothetical protein